MKTKITILCLRETDLEKGTKQFITELVGDTPSESTAKNGIEELLKYVKQVRRID